VKDEFQENVDRRRQARMAKVDAMPANLRELVHDYGLNVVGAFIQCGVDNPRRIKHLVETVLNEFSPTRGSYSSQGGKNYVERKGSG